jgi:nitrile hydratase accessory protein
MAPNRSEILPGLPRDTAGPVFREPWEAQAFAMALALHERGLFTWSEWAATLADEIKNAQAAGDPDTGSTYFRHWLNALERLVAEKNLASEATLARATDLRPPRPLAAAPPGYWRRRPRPAPRD